MTEHFIYVIVGNKGSVQWHVCWRPTLEDALKIYNLLVSSAESLYDATASLERGNGSAAVYQTAREIVEAHLRLDPQCANGGANYRIIKISEDMSTLPVIMVQSDSVRSYIV